MHKYVDHLVTGLKWIGAFAIAAMMLLTCADVVMRAAGRPIRGAVEMVGFLATLALACSLPYTHVVGGHVGVDMLVRRLPKGIRHGVEVFTGLLALGLFMIVSWRSLVYASTLKASGQVSMTLELPSYLFVYFIGLAFGVLSLVILVEILTTLKKAAE